MNLGGALRSTLLSISRKISLQRLPLRVRLILSIPTWPFTSPGPEPIEAKILREVLRRGDVVVEVGARTGGATRPISSLIGEEGRVLAVEANPYSIMRLSNFTKSLKNVQVLNAAISDKEGIAFLSLRYTDDEGASLLPLSDSRHKVKVVTMKLDRLLARLNLPHVDVIIIDVEGHELEVLIGAAETLLTVRAVLVELHHLIDPRIEAKTTGLLSKLDFQMSVRALIWPGLSMNLYVKNQS